MAGNRPTDEERVLGQDDLGFGDDAHERASELDAYASEDSGQAMLRVRVSLKGRPIRSYTFDKDVITVGRDPDSDIPLDNPGISRHHLRLERTSDGYYAADLGSANGSYLNDEPVQKELLRSDDVVRVGKFSLWISYEEDRRRHESQSRVTSHATQQGTTVLSTTELETMMAKARKIDEKPVAPPATKAPQPRSVSESTFITWIILTLVLGVVLGAGVLWLLTR